MHFFIRIFLFALVVTASSKSSLMNLDSKLLVATNLDKNWDGSAVGSIAVLNGIKDVKDASARVESDGSQPMMTSDESRPIASYVCDTIKPDTAGFLDGLSARATDFASAGLKAGVKDQIVETRRNYKLFLTNFLSSCSADTKRAIAECRTSIDNKFADTVAVFSS